MNIYSYDEGGYILAGEPVEAGPQPETYCFDLSDYGTGHKLRVELNMSQGSNLTVSETYFRSADLPNGWSSDAVPDGMPCLGYEEGGLIIPYLGEEKVGLSHSPDVTAGCAHDICFTIAAVDGGGQFTATSGGQTLDNTSISSPGEYCINLSSGSYSDLDLEWTTTSVTMTLTDVEIIETCDIFTQVADVKSGQGYYPFGQALPGRNFNSGDYSRGFQGQLKVDEVSGSGNHYTAEYWEYDPRLGKRWNPDPVEKTHESPYAAFANNPMMFIDPDGRDTSFASKETKDRFDEAYDKTNEIVSKYEKKMDKYESKRKDGDISDRELEKYADLATEYRGWKDIQDDFNEIIDKNTPEVVYEISDVKSQGNAGLTVPDINERGKRIYNVFLSNGYPNKNYTESVIIHENYHVNQHFEGGRYSQQEEISAYSRQSVYSPGFVRDFINQSGGNNLREAVQLSYPLLREY